MKETNNKTREGLILISNKSAEANANDYPNPAPDFHLGERWMSFWGWRAAQCGGSTEGGRKVEEGKTWNLKPLHARISEAEGVSYIL